MKNIIVVWPYFEENQTGKYCGITMEFCEFGEYVARGFDFQGLVPDSAYIQTARGKAKVMTLSAWANYAHKNHDRLFVWP